MYIPQIYYLKDKYSNNHEVSVMKDYDTNTYVGTIYRPIGFNISGGRYIYNGNKRQAVLATGEAAKPHSAAYAAMKEYNHAYTQ